MKVGDIVSIGERNGMIVRDCSVCEENDPNCEAYGKFVVADAQHREMLFVTEDEMDLVSACPFDVNTETVLSILNPANGET